MSTQKAETLREAEIARGELYETLGLLSQRLNYAQRFDDALDRTRARLQQKQRDNPIGFALAVAGAATATGLAVWAGASKLMKTFS